VLVANLKFFEQARGCSAVAWLLVKNVAQGAPYLTLTLLEPEHWPCSPKIEKRRLKTEN
jgi:hypothetical protein